MAESALPFPTPTRVAFAREVHARRIRWYNWLDPQAWHTVTGAKCTAALDELLRAGLAYVAPTPGGESTVAELAEAGIAHFKIRDEAGPGSTSPEPGPATCPDYPDCSEERLVRDLNASVRLGEPVGRWTSGCAACGTLTKGDLE